MDVLSFHLCIEAKHNRVCRGGHNPSPEDIATIKQADAVLLPPYCKESLYQRACDYCTHVFPNYKQRYQYPGKTGQAALFQDMNVSHPKTQIYRSISSWHNGKDRQFDFPFVFKLDWGGEGNNVHLVHTEEELTDCLVKAETWEHDQNKPGFVLQQYIPTGGRSLRVVVINKKYFSYWRRGAEGCDTFYSNIAKGASIDQKSDPHLQQAAVTTLKKFCQQTQINLAGFDFIFNKDDSDNSPYFLEINYCFRTTGLGGPGVYQLLLEQGVREWLTKIGLYHSCREN